jgi:hypothetical protein
MYLSSLFTGMKVNEDDFLFPEPKQEQRFSKILASVLAENKAEVNSL